MGNPDHQTADEILAEIETAHAITQVDSINSAPGLLFMPLERPRAEGITLDTSLPVAAAEDSPDF